MVPAAFGRKEPDAKGLAVVEDREQWFVSIHAEQAVGTACGLSQMTSPSPTWLDSTPLNSAGNAPNLTD